MADDSMDFKTDVVPGADVPMESLEPPPMDLEETSCPQDPTEDRPSIGQETSPASGGVEVTLTSLNVEPGGPGMTEIQSKLGHVESPEWHLDPKDSSPQVNTEVGLEGSRVDMEEGVAEPPREPSPSWATDRGLAAEVGNVPQAPSGIPQSDPLMELEAESEDVVASEDVPEVDRIPLQGLLAQLERLSPSFHDSSPTSEDGLLPASDGEESPACGEEQSLLHKCRGPPGKCGPCPLHVATGHGLGAASHWVARAVRGTRKSRGLLSAETDREDLLNLLSYEGGILAELDDQTPLAHSDVVARSGGQGQKVGGRAETPLGSSEVEKEEPRQPEPRKGLDHEKETPSDSSMGPRRKREPPPAMAGSIAQENKLDLSSFPAYKEVPGPCEPEDLREGVIFGAKYLGSTQLVSERNPPSSVRMAQAQEAVDRIKAPEGESQPMTEVDLFVSTQRIKVLTTDSQEAMMDHPLQTISYIADIGNIVVLMARRKLPRQADTAADKQLYKIICHVFHSADAQLIAQAIGQAFSVAYQHFLRTSGIDPSQLSPRNPNNEGDDDDDDTLAKGEELYNGDLAHFSKQENCKEVIIPKQKGEILGVVIVESGWGSILPTVVIANLMHGGAAERSGKLSIGDRIMSVNGTSLVGLPLTSCQNIIRDLKNQTEVTLTVVHCPPVTTAIVRRPDTKYPLGFCVENGIICSLMRGGIAERGGIRVGHHIIEINGQSVVAMPHEKIIQILTQVVSEVRIKTMPASTYRLLTGQEQPVFL